MATLKLTFEGKLIKEYRLDTGMSLSIGRRLGNDVVVEDPTASRDHAKIESSGGRFLLTDLNSKNGTFINKAPVSSRWLEDGDVVTIGRHHLSFVLGEDGPQPEIKVDTPQQVVFMDPDTEIKPEMTAILSKRIFTGKSDSEMVGVLSFLAGGEGEVQLTKELTKVGKDSSCDIVLRGLMIGKVAFTLGRKPNGYYLSFVGGVSLPKVNGLPIRQSMKLEDLDIIEIGSTKLQFFTRTGGVTS